MSFLAASKGKYFQWTQLSQEWTNIGEHCSSTEFSSAAETV